MELLASLQSRLADPLAPRRAWAGAWCAAQGALLVLRSPPLLGLAVPAVLVHLALYPVALWGAWQAWPWLHDKLFFFARPEATWALVLWGAGYAFTWLLVGVVLFLAALWLVSVTAAAAAGPFLDALSERAEGLLSRTTPPPSPGLVHGAWITLRSTAGLVLLYVLLASLALLLGVVPVVGTLAAPVVHGVTTLGFACVQMMEFPALRHGMGLRARLRMVRRHWAPCLGFGLVAWVMMFFPVSLPLLVAGGTLLFLGLAAGEQPAA